MKKWLGRLLVVACAVMLLCSGAAALAEETAEAPAEVTAETAAETAEEAKEETQSGIAIWLNDLVSKFGKTPLEVWISFSTLIALGVVLLAIAHTRKLWTTKAIAYGALSVALSFVLSCIRLFRMPNGGSVTPGSMLPIMLFSAALFLNMDGFEPIVKK